MAIEVKVYPNGDYWQGKWYDANGQEHKCGLGSMKKVSLRQARKKAAELAESFAVKPGMAAAGKSPRLADYIARHIAGRTDLSKGSLYNLDLTGRYLRAHFGDDIRLDSVTRDKAREWRAAAARGDLIAQVRKLADPDYTPDPNTERAKPSETTVCNVTKYAKSIFQQAADDDLIQFNPFDKLTSTAPEPAKDWGYISTADLEKLLAACDSAGWKVLIGLCRLAGLRRSEAVALPWSAIDWDKRRLTVFASKTKNTSATGGKRVIPIDPRLYTLLLEAFENATEGQVRAAGTSTNNLLRDFDVIRKRAELPEMAEPFQNMRRSRAQDWSQIVPMNTLAEWMGHSIEVAAKYYLKTDDGTFAKIDGTAAAAAKIDVPQSQSSQT